MKLIALGDTHGRTAWQRVVATQTFDKLVLLGDYFDSREGIAAGAQMDNFRQLVDYKATHPDKVTLLLGNHDFHYLRWADGDQYSGFQEDHAPDIGALLHEAINRNLLQMCYAHGKILFTHAGITQTWAQNSGLRLSNDAQSVAGELNRLFAEQPEAFAFTMGENYSMSGDDVCQSPIWVRPRSLTADAIEHFVQVVGHTPQRELVLYPPLVFIDALGTSGQYLVVENGRMSVEAL